MSRLNKYVKKYLQAIFKYTSEFSSFSFNLTLRFIKIIYYVHKLNAHS